jgi:hypothetical protein
MKYCQQAEFIARLLGKVARSVGRPKKAVMGGVATAEVSLLLAELSSPPSNRSGNNGCQRPTHANANHFRNKGAQQKRPVGRPKTLVKEQLVQELAGKRGRPKNSVETTVNNSLYVGYNSAVLTVDRRFTNSC